jgi:cysteinyl-tRNA synthetase
MVNGLKVLREISYNEEAGIEQETQQAEQIQQMVENIYRAINDDLNTAQVIAQLFNMLKKINGIQTGQLNPAALGKESFKLLKSTYETFVLDILGLKEEKIEKAEEVIESLLKIYAFAKSEKNYAMVDQIRSDLKAVGVAVKDMKTGISWAYEE